MTPEKFKQYADQGYSKIPLMKTILADLETPLSAYMKLANGPYSYLFESVQGGENWGRYSIIGLPCNEVIKITGNNIRLESNGRLTNSLSSDAPLDWVRQYASTFNIPDIDGLPRFSGGLVGYFGYETIHYIEPKVAENSQQNKKEDPIGSPDILLMISEEVLIFDNVNNQIMIVTHVDPTLETAYQDGLSRLEELSLQLNTTEIRSTFGQSQSPAIDESGFVSGFTQEGFQEAVKTVKDYIVEGDVMQVVLSQRMSIPYEEPPIDLYRALRCLNPSPYMYHLNLDDTYVVGSSPEILTRLEDEQVTVRPIAGTRPRGATREEDEALEKELLADPKECAEHLMLIDLGRNDAGRVCKTGTVELTDKMVIERYSHVMHIVSNVTGQLEAGLNAIDVLEATFPAGTVSGAPKVRAMQIIDELEPVKRGIYSGAVGYLSWSGNLDTAIAIRTAVIKDGQLNIQAGAGIVHDSVPENEWAETMNKGRAIFKAVAMAKHGLEEGEG
ncbi:MAG: anthranilate synthase component 1 [Cycloclasticus pugetii]|jgi:anthranilate synthase component 1|uniref:Anthranilate synthase component 1 n=1 Tax=Cycloclasticus pugetii TaxID=34068 RepID=A0AB33Z1C9_9GAMM|nr:MULTISPECIES: anthranilate synthase component I [Cycloclasticus]AFT68034.1 Anthranilate synthase component I [Cycloclasticus sp. P1]ATI02432.1 anthranilate synthase component I [Cycloclasticus sp. PY97N]EPD12894.1 anthranilate synthase [Cycloclasticus pugetii]MBV1899500.1 anthranilate synthase component I [Cycloclasticus sp.]MDF1830070.1 anthranilate synthase component I [Cycloclasticus pugetii]